MSFRANYPFDFYLLNSRDEDVFYLEDKVEGVTLNIVNQLAVPIQLSPSSAEATKDAYHFALKFRPEVLTTLKNTKQGSGDWKISSAVLDEQGCSVLYLLYTGTKPLICESKDSIEIKFSVDINGGKGTRTTNVELLGRNINADTTPLADFTRQINWTLINHRGKSGMPIQLSFKDADTILNDGTPNSLRLRLVNTDKITADNDNAITFTENSKILFFFEPNANSTASSLASADSISAITIIENPPSEKNYLHADSKPSKGNPLPVWSFTAAAKSGLKLLPMVGDSSTGSLVRSTPPQVKVTTINSGLLTYKTSSGRLVQEGEKLFTIDDRDILASISGKLQLATDARNQLSIGSPLAGDMQLGYIQSSVGVQNDKTPDAPDNITYLDFAIDNIITDYITGKTKLSVRLENIPGYWDETFILYIDKQPLIFQKQNIGIGTNAPAQKLQVVVNNAGLNVPLLLSNLNGAENRSNAVGVGFLNEANGNWYKAAVVHERTNSYGVGSLKFLVSNEANTNPVTLAHARLTIASNGKTGINTSAPEQTLDVVGSFGIRNSAAWDHMSLHHDGYTGFIDAGGADNGLSLRVGNGATGSYGGQAYNEAMLLKPNGQVVINGSLGIGTANPSKKLEVNGDLQAGNYFIKGTHLVYDSQHAVIDWGSQGSGNLYFRSLPNQGNIGNSRDVAVITGDGKMGVNTNAPQQTLDVVGSFGIRNGAAWDHMLFYHDGVTGCIAAGGAEGGLSLRVGDTNSGTYGQQAYNEAMLLKADRNVIINNGRLGIGNSNPEFPLDINSFANTWMGEGTMFLHQQYECRRSGSGYNNSVAIRVSSSVYSKAFYCYSDERIKENITAANGKADLEALNKLAVKHYYCKDFIAQGSGLKKGFIAQEVEKIIPEAVATSKDFTPGIYALPTQTTLTDGQLTLSMQQAHQLSTGDRVRIVTHGSGAQDVPVRVLDELTFAVEDWTFPTERLFVYGKEVEDFRALDYDYVFCTGISAMQELSRQVDTLTQQLRQQEARLQRLEALLALPAAC